MAAAGVVYQRTGEWLETRRFGRAQLVRLSTAKGRHRIYWDARGQGTPAVLLESGLAATSLSWALVQDQLARATQVCSYDRAGLGWSERGHGKLTVESILHDLEALIATQLGSDPVVLAGHSFGGMLVRAYACRQPDRVAGLVLVDPVSIEHWAGCGEAERRRLQMGAKLSRRGAWLAKLGVVRLCLQILAAGHTSLPKWVARASAAEGSGLVTRLTGEVRRLPRDLWPVVRAHWSRASSFRVMADYLDALPESARATQHLIVPRHIPVTILSAQSATAAERSERDRWAAESVLGKHLPVPDCGHWIQLEKPSIVIDAITEMVETIRSR